MRTMLGATGLCRVLLMLLAGTSYALATPYSFTPTDCSGLTTNGGVVGTSAVVLQPAALSSSIPRPYLKLAIIGSGTVCVTFDGTAPVLNSGSDTCYSTTTNPGDEFTVAYGFVPPGPVTAIGSAAGIVFSCKVWPN